MDVMQNQVVQMLNSPSILSPLAPERLFLNEPKLTINTITVLSNLQIVKDSDLQWAMEYLEGKVKIYNNQLMVDCDLVDKASNEMARYKKKKYLVGYKDSKRQRMGIESQKKLSEKTKAQFYKELNMVVEEMTRGIDEANPERDRKIYDASNIDSRDVSDGSFYDE